MAPENAADLVNSLTPKEQDAVRQFIQFLRNRTEPERPSFSAAIDEFINEHQELLQRLAQ